MSTRSQGLIRQFKLETLLIKPQKTSEKPYVAKVHGFEQGSRGSIKVKLQWFYRPEDTPNGRQKFHGHKEIFLSNHYDTQHAKTIYEKCIVHDFISYSMLKSVQDIDFFCRFEYDTSSRCATTCDKIDMLCKCKTPNNPDLVMISCERCDDWFHPECIGITVEQAETIEHFFCDICEKLDNGNHRVVLVDKCHQEVEITTTKDDSVVRLCNECIISTNSLKVDLCEKCNQEIETSTTKDDSASAKLCNECIISTNSLLGPLFQGIISKCGKLWFDRLNEARENLTRILKEEMSNDSFSDKIDEESVKFVAALDKLHHKDLVATTAELAMRIPIKKLAVIYDEGMLLHVHPHGIRVEEKPSRLTSIMHKLKVEKLIDRCDVDVLGCEEASRASLVAVHSSTHIDDILSISSISQLERDALALKHDPEGDIYYSEGSGKAAFLAAGGTLKVKAFYLSISQVKLLF